MLLKTLLAFLLHKTFPFGPIKSMQDCVIQRGTGLFAWQDLASKLSFALGYSLGF